MNVCDCGTRIAEGEKTCLWCIEHPEDRPVKPKVVLPKTKKPVPYWQKKLYEERERERRCASHPRTDARREYEREYKRARRAAQREAA